MQEALCRPSGTTLDIVHAEDGPPITQRTSGLDGGQYALARLPADPNPFQAARPHSALPACARRQAAFRAGLADEIKFDGYRVIGCKDGERVRARYRLPDYHSKKEKNPAKRSSPGS